MKIYSKPNEQLFSQKVATQLTKLKVIMNRHLNYYYHPWCICGYFTQKKKKSFEIIILKAIYF